jgi:glutamate--cysteine ligase
MSKPSEIDKHPIGEKKELIEWFEKGCTPADKLLIGVEHEKPPFYLADNAPVPYADEQGGRPAIREWLEQMVVEKGWRPGDPDNGHIVELQRNSVNWSLEPGGQMETGGAPLKNVHQNARETDESIREAVAVARNLGIGLLAMGYHPTHTGKDMPYMPKSRYAMFREYVEQKKFAHGVDQMTCTSTVQVNLGYKSEADMVKKLRVSLALQPIVVALFANSPFCEGQDSGYQSYRSHMIHNNWGGRYGSMLPIAFDKDFGFEKFADYAMNAVPMLGIYKGNTFLDAHGAKFQDFMEGKLEICPGQVATLTDWSNHLNTIWPEVRLRRFLEMRGADNGPAEMIKALPAFWVGILYDDQSLDAAYEMIRDWTLEEREYLRLMTPQKGLQTPFMNGTTNVQEIAKNCLKLAEEGLKRRNIKDAAGNDESVYLAPLHEIANSGKNWAQRLLEKYHGEWKGDINKLFAEMSYENEPSVLKSAAPSPAAATRIAPPENFKP